MQKHRIESASIKSKRSSNETTTSAQKKDEDNRRKIELLATPRNYGQKPSPYDVNVPKKNITKAPKKTGSTIVSKETPMKNVLKSSASSVSQISNYSNKIRTTPRVLPTRVTNNKEIKTGNVKTSNVTVNSPKIKRKLDLTAAPGGGSSKSAAKTVENGGKFEKNGEDRERTKTRTLKSDEVKVLKVENVNNNEEMQKLSRSFRAEPKAFFVDLDDNLQKPSTSDHKPIVEDDYSDDFESYESDFESYKSETSLNDSDNTETEHSETPDGADDRCKRDEERMLDSGSFDLREAQRSANKTKPGLDDILEGAGPAGEDRKSLTDEGFQEMAMNSASFKHEAVESEPYLDLEKSKSARKRLKASQRLKQRAKDILSMVTLHEMKYSLFEFHPIPYDVYMATFGRTNHLQRATQTFDDGITEEVQTDEVITQTKWTQFPIEFSNSLVCFESKCETIKKTKSEIDFLGRFTLLLEQEQDNVKGNKLIEDDYEMNSLRIFLDQKNGVGSSDIMSVEQFESKIKNVQFNQGRLRRFLKRRESCVSSILNANAGNSNVLEAKTTKLPFSRGSTNLYRDFDDNLKILKDTKVSNLTFSQTKNNLLFTIHDTNKGPILKSFACLWDISGVNRNRKPLKILTAIDKIEICLFTGNISGFFISSLKDGSIHCWDLSEEPAMFNVASGEKATELVEINTEGLTQTEIDREWNYRNNFTLNEDTQSMQSSAFTTSFMNMSSGEPIDTIVGLEFVHLDLQPHENEHKKIFCQICSLQKFGIITLWMVIQDKAHIKQDAGRAVWSKIYLDKIYTINLTQNIEISNQITKFNLQTTKKRLSIRKKGYEKSRLKSAAEKKQNADSFSVASGKNTVSLGRNSDSGVEVSWECSVVCTCVKVVNYQKNNVFLIGKNCGEVLCCKRTLGNVKIDRIFVSSDKSSVTCIEPSSLGLPYFMAGTDTGTLHLCSLVDHRVLLTLDNRNTSLNTNNLSMERCQSDLKGRFIGSIPTRQALNKDQINCSLSSPSISSIIWSADNPCHIFTLTHEGAASVWDLMWSDINCKSFTDRVATLWCKADGNLALINHENSVEIHALKQNNRLNYLDIFDLYVQLL